MGFINIKHEEDLDTLKKSIINNDMTIDSIFGIGLTRDVGGLFYNIIQIINQYSKDILSVDIPSGLDGDTGKALGISVKANKTVTLHYMKKGLINRTNYTGELIVEDIGIPKKATEIVLQQSL